MQNSADVCWGSHSSRNHKLFTESIQATVTATGLWQMSQEVLIVLLSTWTGNEILPTNEKQSFNAKVEGAGSSPYTWVVPILRRQICSAAGQLRVGAEDTSQKVRAGREGTPEAQCQLPLQNVPSGTARESHHETETAEQSVASNHYVTWKHPN